MLLLVLTRTVVTLRQHLRLNLTIQSGRLHGGSILAFASAPVGVVQSGSLLGIFAGILGKGRCSLAVRGSP